MTPEAERYLAKARLTLGRMRLMLTVYLTEDAGRSVHLAGYQAAAAFIFERIGRSPRRGLSILSLACSKKTR